MNIITYLYEKTRPYHFNIILSILVIIFSLVAYYSYNTYFASKQSMKPFDDVANANDDNNFVQIYFFHAQWCPYCQKAYPEWTKFATVNNNKTINGYLVECINVDCTGDNGDTTNEFMDKTPAEIADLIQEFKVDSYPTIKMIKDGETIEFQAKITESSLQKFLDNVVNE
jgi:thiol-disulfide isomerase/thioredoxin